jgi:hypothetical protein
MHVLAVPLVKNFAVVGGFSSSGGGGPPKASEEGRKIITELLSTALAFFSAARGASQLSV